jgi:N-acetylglutamate synthase-like GNAT family acetyltransferase
MGPDIQIRLTTASDSEQIRLFTREQWADEFVVAHGVIYHPDQLPGFIVKDEKDAILGLATYSLNPPNCELVTLNAEPPGKGVGTALVSAVVDAAKKAKCTRLWLITTNDSVDALAFYQKRGFHLVAVHPNALDVSRKLKPTIPLIASNGIPLRDEIEMELILKTES